MQRSCRWMSRYAADCTWVTGAKRCASATLGAQSTKSECSIPTGVGLSCPPHGHGQHAGEIRFWPLPQKRLALHHVVNGFGDIGRVIAHALEILCTKHQVRAEGHGDGFFHHIREKLLR